MNEITWSVLDEISIWLGWVCEVVATVTECVREATLVVGIRSATQRPANEGCRHTAGLASASSLLHLFRVAIIPERKRILRERERAVTRKPVSAS